ncbi:MULTISPECIES: DUF4167 domain-containing protein [unclassified Bradyrhizobium]
MPRRRSWKGKAQVARQSQNAKNAYQRYLDLARTTALRGDLVAAENYLQHAEHYLRSMRERQSADSPHKQ